MWNEITRESNSASRVAAFVKCRVSDWSNSSCRHFDSQKTAICFSDLKPHWPRHVTLYGAQFHENAQQLNSFLLSRNEQDTNHKRYMWHGMLAGNLILVKHNLFLPSYLSWMHIVTACALLFGLFPNLTVCAPRPLLQIPLTCHCIGIQSGVTPLPAWTTLQCDAFIHHPHVPHLWSISISIFLRDLASVCLENLSRSVLGFSFSLGESSAHIAACIFRLTSRDYVWFLLSQ